MSYEVRLYREVAKALDRMDRTTEARILRRLRELAEELLAPRLSKPLVGLEGLRSSRVGDWSILFTVNDAAKAVEVVAVRPRGQAYRRLERSW